MGCNKVQELPTLALPMDTRSPAGSAGKRVWALVLNAQADISGRMMRLGGWRKFGWQAEELGLFVNQDFHDQLDSAVSSSATCAAPTSVAVAVTGSYSDGSFGIGLSHDGEKPSRIRWYKNGVLIHDSNA